MQVAEEVFLLSRTVRTFGTEESEKKRYQSRLGILRHISIRQAGAYLLYLTSNSFLFNLTKVGKHISQNKQLLSISSFQPQNVHFDSETYPYIGSLNSEMSGDSKHVFLHCGDVKGIAMSPASGFCLWS